MNSTRTIPVCSSLSLILLWLIACSYLSSISAEPYKIESRIRGGHKVIKVTCLDTDATTSPLQIDEKSKRSAEVDITNDQRTKRSLASYGTYENDVPNSGLNTQNDFSVTDKNDGNPNHGKNERVDPFNEYETDQNDSYLNETYVDVERNTSNSHPDSQSTGENVLSSSSNKHKHKNNGNTHLTIHCNFLELNKNIFNSSMHKLEIKTSGVLNFTSDWADSLPDLSRLKIRSKQDRPIPNDCSWVPSSVHSLDLSYILFNNITLFNCPESLNHLIMQRMSLHTLSICIPSLHNLDVSWNSISNEGLGSICRETSESVKHLKLHNNQIKSWTFCGWTHLKELELQRNELHSIDISCIPHNLLQLTLDNNLLELPPTHYPPKLTSLSISHNRLKNLTHFNRAIQVVDLSHNSLTGIGKGVFRAASSLLSLDLSYNRLTVIYGHDFSGLHALRYLDLNSNAITHIWHQAFHPLQQIKFLRIDSNSLHQVDARLLANLPKKIRFKATNNPWKCSCHLLASLNKHSTAFCKPNCRDLTELTCREGNQDIKAQEILRQCIEALQETEMGQPIYVLPVNKASDEDTSEEQRGGGGGSSRYYAVIPVAVLFLATPVIAVGIRKIYLNRKRILKRCNCFSSPSTDNEVSSNVHCSIPNMEHESDSADSETEF